MLNSLQYKVIGIFAHFNEFMGTDFVAVTGESIRLLGVNSFMKLRKRKRQTASPALLYIEFQYFALVNRLINAGL